MSPLEQRSAEFSTVRNATHTRPSLSCGNFAAIRFRSYWFENATSAAFYDDGIDKYNISIVDVERRTVEHEEKTRRDFFNSLVAILDKQTGAKLDAKNDNYALFTISHSDYPAQCQAAVTLHSGRVSLTTIFDFSRADNPLDNLVKRSKEESLRQLSVILESNKAPIDSQYDCEASLKNAAKYLFDKCWDNFETITFSIGDDGSPSSTKPFSENAKFMRMFADFRGLVIPDDVHRLKAGSDIQHSSPPHSAQLSSEKVVEKLWPLLESCENRHLGSDSEDPLKTVDVVTCDAGDGSAIYMSTLGRAKKNEHDEKRPVSYILVSRNGTPRTARREIGRTIDRINKLGVYRFLALRNTRQLHAASSSLRSLGPALDKISDHFIKSTISNDEDERNRSYGRGMYEIARFTEALNSLGRGADTKGQQTFTHEVDLRSAPVSGGLEFRLSRSLLYKNAFLHNQRELKIRKIPGYQSYEEFMARNLAPEFDFIEDLGNRINNMRRKYRDVLLFVESIQHKHLERERVKIARYGETLEILVIAYYISTIASHLISGTTEWFGAKMDNYYEHFIIAFGYMLVALVVKYCLPPLQRLLK